MFMATGVIFLVIGSLIFLAVPNLVVASAVAMAFVLIGIAVFVAGFFLTQKWQKSKDKG